MSQNKPAENHYPFLAGGGSMGELIRNFAWQNTALGNPKEWPSTLKIYISMLLGSPFPMHLTWGENLLQFYNDAYRPILGELKHPGALGIPISESFPEIWKTISPMLTSVWEGNPVRIPNFKVYLERNGYSEECYFDFAYSPITDEHGIISGVLTNVIETTDRVKAFRELETTREELRLSQSRISEERDRLMQFFMESPVGICILDGPDLRYEMVNPLYQKLFPGRELLGKKLLDAIPELKEDKIIGVLHGVMSTGITYNGVNQLIPMSRTESGEIEQRYFDFIYQARFDSDRKPKGILVFALEVTEHKLEEQRKNDFISIVSHELNTPLTSLNGVVQLVESRMKTLDIDDEFLSRGMTRATIQVKRMASMISGFLNVSRLESGQIYLNKTELDFTTLVVEAMDELQLSSSRHQLIMECRDKHMILVDKEKMISVITNLMANAVKYSPKGGKIEIDCSVKEDNLIFSVKDNGIGIANHDLTYIFERYYRVSERQTKNISGFGIGLYLSAQIVELHQGRIWTESHLEQGSQFFVSLPLSA